MPEWFNVQITTNELILSRGLPGGDGFPVLVAAVDIRLGEAVELAAWQRRAGQPRIPVVIETESADVAAPEAASIGITRKYGTAEILCRLLVPRMRLAQHPDGVVGLRMLQAALAALDAIGQRFGFGPVPIRKVPATRSEFDAGDYFAPHTGTEVYYGVADWVRARVAATGSEEALVMAPAQAPPDEARARTRLLDRLDTVLAEETVTADNGKAFYGWTIRLTL
jgi:hypothetical protein